MGKITKIEIGQALPPEDWLAARDDLAAVFPLIGEYLKRLNGDGMGEQDKEEFMWEAMLALQAMTYVAAFASDSCRFVIIPWQDGGR